MTSSLDTSAAAEDAPPPGGAADPAFLGPGLALPPGILAAADYADLAARLCARTPREAALIRTATLRTGIERRHSVLVGGAGGAGGVPFFDEPFARGAPPPGTQARMVAYERQAPPLAIAAARALLDAEEIAPRDVSHVVTVTCTGFMSPGLDYHLVNGLELTRATRKLHLGFLGCHAALNAFGAGRAICLGDPRAVVLVVLVELCTLHFQHGLRRDDLLPNSLFADGAAAFVLAGADTRAARAARYALTGTRSHLIPDTADLMTWRITDSGFRMTLDSSVPDVVGRALPGLARDWGWDAAAPDTAWAIHPGGPRIVEGAAAALGLGADATRASRDVLRRHGNMSSATLLFILAALLPAAPRVVHMLAFGPGLNVEGGTLERRV